MLGINYWVLTYLWFHLISDVNGYCAAKCQLEYTAVMHSILGEIPEWSMESLMPIQTLMKQSNSYKAVHELTKSACRSAREQKRCLAKCPQSTAKVVLLASLEPWIFVCGSLKRHGALPIIFKCLHDNVHYIEHECYPEAGEIERVFEETRQLQPDSTSSDAMLKISELCEALKDFEICHEAANRRYCRSTNFLSDLRNVTSSSVKKILKLSSVRDRLPDSCITDWTPMPSFTHPTLLPTITTTINKSVPSTRKPEQRSDVFRTKTGSGGNNFVYWHLLKIVMILLCYFMSYSSICS